jgi:hypothetical protein
MQTSIPRPHILFIDGLPGSDKSMAAEAVGGHDSLQSQILQALGQSFALTALVFLIVQSINPGDALTIGALLQTRRLFGGEIGTALMQTFVRQREQIHSNLIGLHVDALAELTTTRLHAGLSWCGWGAYL